MIEWLIAGISVATFGVIVVAARKLERDAQGAERLALGQAAAQFGLQQVPGNKWTGSRVFSGTVRGFTVTWTLTPSEIAREIRVSVAQPKLIARQLSNLNPIAMRIGATLTLEGGILELRFKDTLGDDCSELVPSTNRLLALAMQLGND